MEVKFPQLYCFNHSFSNSEANSLRFLRNMLFTLPFWLGTFQIRANYIDPSIVSTVNVVDMKKNILFLQCHFHYKVIGKFYEFLWKLQLLLLNSNGTCNQWQPAKQWQILGKWEKSKYINSFMKTIWKTNSTKNNFWFSTPLKQKFRLKGFVQCSQDSTP